MSLSEVFQLAARVDRPTRTEVVPLQTASARVHVAVHLQLEAHNEMSKPELWVAGIGAQYPPYALGTEKLEQFAARFYDVQAPG
jgi:hypothetical protein